jgi:hypothetical protein
MSLAFAFEAESFDPHAAAVTAAASTQRSASVRSSRIGMRKVPVVSGRLAAVTSTSASGSSAGGGSNTQLTPLRCDGLAHRLSGAGKSTLAAALAERLAELGHHTRLLRRGRDAPNHLERPRLRSQ